MTTTSHALGIDGVWAVRECTAREEKAAAGHSVLSRNESART